MNHYERLKASMPSIFNLQGKTASNDCCVIADAYGEQ